MTPEDRLAVIVDTAAIRVADEPERLSSWSNDVWRLTDAVFGRCVLRICAVGDRARLVTEARIGRALPPRIGYPRVLSYGWSRDDHDLSWLLTPEVTGRPLAEVWSSLAEDERSTAAGQSADLLRSLHRWRPSAALTDRLLSWRRHRDPTGIVGATLLPLPLWRAETVAAALLDRPAIDSTVVQRSIGWLRDHPDLAPRLDWPDLAVTHGDLHLDNLWWDDGRVRRLLDLEWVRLAPPYLDLARTDEDDEHDEFGRLLLAHYPELAVEQWPDRLRYLRIAYELRQLWVWPEPVGDVAEDHPVRRLAGLLDG